MSQRKNRKSGFFIEFWNHEASASFGASFFRYPETTRPKNTPTAICVGVRSLLSCLKKFRTSFSSVSMDRSPGEMEFDGDYIRPGLHAATETSAFENSRRGLRRGGPGPPRRGRR